ncbi:hypothetical protein RAC89_19145 [Paenibacillus sp. GD4]|nr:hypothetical protein [Paenibacillus sp. GD4]MDQ1912513.1 hypothetical protein [Paenibacillus sp. GD4]
MSVGLYIVKNQAIYANIEKKRDNDSIAKEIAELERLLGGE